MIRLKCESLVDNHKLNDVTHVKLKHVDACAVLVQVRTRVASVYMITNLFL